MKWKIYYSDNTTFCDEDGSPFDAPSRKVQIIAQEHKDVGKFLLGKNDYYWWDSGWSGGDIFGLFDYLLDSGPKKVIFGRTVDSDLYNDIGKTALSDTYLPFKTGKIIGEN